MAAVVALVLIVPGSLIVVAALAIAWTALFACLHVIGDVVSPVRSQVRARAEGAEARRIDSVEIPVVLPEPASG